MNYPTPFIDYYTTLQVKFSSLRKEVLYILWCAQKPLKAYEILDCLLKTKANSKPPTVYRSLEFLSGYGIVHKIESIQSYTLCREPEKHLFSEVLMVCTSCHQVIEVHDVTLHDLMIQLAQKSHFKLGEDTIELKGVCHSCEQGVIPG